MLRSDVNLSLSVYFNNFSYGPFDGYSLKLHQTNTLNFPAINHTMMATVRTSEMGVAIGVCNLYGLT